MQHIPNVLVVDDHEVNIEVLEVFLGQLEQQVKVFTARNGVEALKIIESTELDLVLLDVMMPELDGFEVCRRIKSGKLQTIPVIMITALNNKESMLEGLKAGADDFLTKPLDCHELMVRVSNLLKLRKVTSDLQRRLNEFRQELELARKLQQGFLPQAIPGIKGLDMGVIYKPSLGIGGDFYDFLLIDENRLGVLIADVTGHGVSSAMITAVLKDHIEKKQNYWAKPKEFFEKLNKEIYHFFNSTGSDYFITAFYGIFDLQNNRMIYSNAGHPAPLHIQGETYTKLKTKQGFPLGLFEAGFYEDGQELFLPGDGIYLFTDGLYELEISQENQTEEVLYDKIIKFRDLPAKEVIREFEEYILQITGGEDPDDDINLIAIKRLAKMIGG